MDSEQFYTIILRHDTSTQWMIVDPVLALGEYGVEDDTHRVKRGDGVSAWSELTYDTFGLEYIVSFANIEGDIDDNEQLKEAFANTLTKEDFADEDGKILMDINIQSSDGVIAKLSKVVKDVKTDKDKEQILVNIISSDNSISGLWYTDKKGITTMDLSATSVIDDFSVDKSYKQNEICFYNDVLYRAKEDVQPGEFDETKWLSMSSSKAEDIDFIPEENTDIKATTVQEAIVELDEQLQAVKQELEDNDLVIY